MENNATDSGGRVTRSLRKRLASVDCDNSGRPETPISSKYTLIPEITASPSRSTRITRRNSTSGVATPVKRVVGISGNIKSITPTKARTRRRSTSVNENEEFSQKNLKILAALDEEIGQSDLKTTRVTRSQSKSPLLSNSCNTSSGIATPMKTPAKSGVDSSCNIENLRKTTAAKACKSPTVLDNETIQCDLKATRATRSQSMSPLLNNGLHTSSGGISLKTSGKRDESTSITKTYTQKHNISTCETEGLPPKSSKVLDALDKDIVENGLKSCRATRSQSKSPLLTNSKHTKMDLGNSPPKMHIQSHSISRNEIDDFSPKNLKVVAALGKEIGESDIKSSRVTRSLSKSPSLSYSKNISSGFVTPMKKRKPGPKSKTRVDREVDEDFSDVEISLFGNEMEENELPNIVGTILSEDDPAKESELEVKRDDLELSHCRHFDEDKTFNTVELQIKNTTTNIEVFKKLIRGRSNLEISGEEQNINIIDNNVQNELVNERGLSKTKNEVKYEESTSKDNKINVSNAEISNYTNVNNINLNDPATLQINNDSKQVRSPQIDDSSQVVRNSLDNSLDKVGENVMTGNYDVGDAKLTPLHTLKYSQTLEVQRTTTINMNYSEQEALHEETKNTSTSETATNILEKDNDNSDSRNGDELKWIIPSVKRRTSKESKLDIVNTQYEKNLNNCCDNTVGVFKQGQTNQINNIVFSSEDEEDNYNKGEDSYKQKHDFIDDEAMEVYDYASGDSMDSEERKDIEENEIPLDGESIGNQTSDDDQEESAEENGSDSDNSFIVSDNEELKFHDSVDDIETDENINEHIETNNKIYKRIKRFSDSSSTIDEDMEENKKFCDKDNISTHKEILKSINAQLKMESVDEELNENTTKMSPEKRVLVEESSLPIKSSESIIPDYKVTDTSLQIHCSDRSESINENSSEEINISQKETNRKLNQSDLSNKSFRNVSSENDTSPAENYETSEGIASKNNYDKSIENIATLRQSEDDLEEVSITSEIDADKENERNSIYLATDRNADIKLLEPGLISSDSAFQENEFASQDIRYLENSTNVSLPLGNPLIRTRHQSLALPTNPDMEICASSNTERMDKKVSRRSLGILSMMDFKPSQSFIDSIELQKNDPTHFITKRKRLSKSFSGASETHENSIVDVDVRHLHKRSKLMDESSVEECKDFTENINSSKVFTKLSSTPCEKINKNVYNSERILSRCEEIIEAANRAKLEDKIRNRKTKSKISKKQLKNKYILNGSEEISADDILRGISKEIKRKDKTKAALSNAIKAADCILGKKKNIHRIQKEQEKLESEEEKEDATEVLGIPIPAKKNCGKEITHKQQKIKQVHATSTSAGIFIELPQSPERKKPTYIRLATGKVLVEPITPKKCLVKSCNGMKFKESPVTPNAVGFKVSEISPSPAIITEKRKRYNKPFRDCTTSKTQWTQSGLFTEEPITKNRMNVTRNRPEKNKEYVANCNFKEKSIMRPEIKRSTKREILLLKERRHVRDAIKNNR